METDNKKPEVRKLQSEIERLKRELKKRKKYGLVWDEEKTKERFEKESENALPVLKEVKSKEIKIDSSKPTNILIEGDNYHILSVLNYTHQGKIDVIYIDPPYNTGAKNWRYNNNYVEKDDAYRHSKWLSFMNKRIVLAKRLLKPKGVFICAIDENEHADLSLILREIFPSHQIDSITVVHNPRGVQGKNFSFTHEYAVFVYPDDGGKYIADAQREESLERNFRVDGSNSPRQTAKTCFYPILVKGEKVVGFGNVADKKFHPKKQTTPIGNKMFQVWPIDIKNIERKWSYSRNTVEEIRNQLRVKKRGSRYEITRIKEKAPYRTVWTGPRFDANEYGSKLVNGLVNSKFPFPKSLYTVKECLLATVANNKNAVVLDFFAGSGTTGHATALLNKEDGGNRQFILCTNNENGIAQEVFYPRIKAVIKGHRNYPDITGITSNLKYFKTDFVSAQPTDRNKFKLTMEATEMLCIKEGTFEEVENRVGFKIFKDGNRYTGIIFDQKMIPAFKKSTRDINGKFSVYIFSLGDDSFDDEFKGLKNRIRISPIPEAILKVYRRILK